MKRESEAGNEDGIRAITRVLTTQHFPPASPPTTRARSRAGTANSGRLVSRSRGNESGGRDSF